jgi:hypothetical protein
MSLWPGSRIIRVKDSIQRFAVPILSAATGACVMLFLVLSFYQAAPPQPDDPIVENIIQCTEKALGPLGGDAKTISAQNDAAEFCYRLLNGGNLLSDFKIRRLKFIQQKYDEVVMLWMVVIITISGVALAGIQLAITYKLSAARKESLNTEATEITVLRDRIVFKSSVTGLAILAISFAFFLVFVLEIYTIREINPDAKVPQANLSDSGSADAQNGANGYGNPPGTPTK